jgi:hypothetical protein
MSAEPESLVLELLRRIRADMATKADLAELRSELKSDIASLRADLTGEMNSLRADVASDLRIMQAKTDAEFKAVREQITGLRRAVIDYHTAVVGHGILISELDVRVRRIEQHLNLPLS